jgi:hypothetical protein
MKSLQKKLQVFRNFSFHGSDIGVAEDWSVLEYYAVLTGKWLNYSQEHSASKTFIIIDQLTYVTSQKT